MLHVTLSGLIPTLTLMFILKMGSDWNCRVLLQRCAEAEPRAIATVREFAADVAAGLISIRNVIDPAKFMSRHRTIIEKAKLGNRAGMIGAAKLAMTNAVELH
jgi:hypothetical protein